MPDIDLPHHRITLRGEHGLTRVIPVDAHGYFYIDWSMGLNDPNLTAGAFEELLAAPGQTRRRPAGGPIAGRTNWSSSAPPPRAMICADTGATALENVTLFGQQTLERGQFRHHRPLHPADPAALNLLLIVLVGRVFGLDHLGGGAAVTGSILMASRSCLSDGGGAALCALADLGADRPAAGLRRVCHPSFRPDLSRHSRAIGEKADSAPSFPAWFRRRWSTSFSATKASRSIPWPANAAKSRVFFADVRGFTELTDAAQARNTEFVRRHYFSPATGRGLFRRAGQGSHGTVSLYLGTIADCVKKHSGTLDKYIGDCVMAFWGAPLPNPRHALDAVRCAIEAQQALAALNARREEENKRREQENLERLRAGSPTVAPPARPVHGHRHQYRHGHRRLHGLGRPHCQLYRFRARGEPGQPPRGRFRPRPHHHWRGHLLALQRDDPALAQTCVELPARSSRASATACRNAARPWRLPRRRRPNPPASPGQKHDNSPAVA